MFLHDIQINELVNKQVLFIVNKHRIFCGKNHLTGKSHRTQVSYCFLVSEVLCESWHGTDILYGKEEGSS